MNNTEFRTGVISPVECVKEGFERIKNDYWLLFAISLVGGLIGGFTMYILAGLLVLGFIANALVTRRQVPSPGSQAPNPKEAIIGSWDLGFRRWELLFAWTGVGVPLAWGTWVTLTQAVVLFTGGR